MQTAIEAHLSKSSSQPPLDYSSSTNTNLLKIFFTNIKKKKF